MVGGPLALLLQELLLTLLLSLMVMEELEELLRVMLSRQEVRLRDARAGLVGAAVAGTHASSAALGVDAIVVKAAPLALDVLLQPGQQLRLETRRRKAALLELDPQPRAAPAHVLILSDLHAVAADVRSLLFFLSDTTESPVSFVGANEYHRERESPKPSGESSLGKGGEEEEKEKQ